MLLVHGTLALMCISFICPKNREYRSLSLALLTIWAGVNMFWRSFSGLQSEEGYIVGFFTQQVNWALLHEGFLYIFCGTFLIRTIVEHAKYWKLYFIPILYCVGYYVCMTGFNMAHIGKCYWGHLPGEPETAPLRWLETDVGWSMTVLLALLLGGTLTLLKHQKTRIWAIIGILGGVGAVAYKWAYIWKVKWISRPDFWKATVARIKPLGQGFYHTINTRKGLIAPELEEFGGCLQRWGAGFRQNDFLEFTEYLGVIALVLVIWFIIQTLWKSKGGLAYFLGLSALFMCMFQRTMYFPEKATVILVIIAMLILENGMAKSFSPLKRRE